MNDNRPKRKLYTQKGFILASILYLVNAAMGTLLAVQGNLPAEFGGKSGKPALEDFLIGNGTALSPPLYLCIVTVLFIILAFQLRRLIFWRRSDDWLALLAAFFLVMFVTTFPGGTTFALALTYPALNVPIMLMSVLGQLSIAAFFVLFPNGRLVPRWIGSILLLRIIQAVFSVFPPTSPFNANNWPGWLNALVAVVSYGAIIFSQVYRYRRVSTPVERQQTKWVVFGIITVAIGFLVFGFIFTLFFPTLGQPDTPYSLIPNIAYPLLTLLLPLSIGVAILRYRLYDIDVLINRTLVYGSLTALLIGLYVGLILALQALVRVLTGAAGQQPLVIVGSTLVIAALFQPLRRRIQAIIDRRFYRRKYDAAKVVAAFSVTLRNEVDLDQLREHLLAVVQETMQPRQVSLWLRKSEKAKNSNVWEANRLSVSHEPSLSSINQQKESS